MIRKLFGSHLTAEQIVLTIGAFLMIELLIQPLHECAHAWAAMKLGDDTAKIKGRLTLNPFAHLDPVGTVSFFLLGFGWGKPVPINPLKFREYRKGIGLSALAGPASNLIAAFVGMILSKVFWYASISSAGSKGLYYVYYLADIFTMLNLGLGLFNLIPIFPLDGEKIFGWIAPKKINDRYYDLVNRYSSFMPMILFAIMMSPLLTWAESGAYWLLDKATFFVDIIGRAVFF